MKISNLALILFLTTRIYYQQNIDNSNDQNQPQTDNGQQQGQVPPQQDFYMASDDEIKQDFYNLDKDENSLLDPHEIRTGIPGIFEDDITGFFSAYDYNKDGVISLEEYMTISKRKNTQQNTTSTNTTNN